MIKELYTVIDPYSQRFFIGLDKSWPHLYAQHCLTYIIYDSPFPENFTHDLDVVKLYPSKKVAENKAKKLNDSYDEAIIILAMYIDSKKDEITTVTKKPQWYPTTGGDHIVRLNGEILELGKRIDEIKNNRPLKIEACTLKATCMII